MPRIFIRQAILDTLQRNHVLSAHQLVEKIKIQRPTINKTTVYRALEQLKEENIVCQQNFSGKESVYELLKHHHDHLSCMICGKIVTTTCNSLKMPKTIDGFTIDHHHLTYYGYCNDCKKT